MNDTEKLKIAMEALDAIRFATGSMPEAWNDEASWYRSSFYDCVATAGSAMRRIEE